jgi:hypothetical protein
LIRHDEFFTSPLVVSSSNHEHISNFIVPPQYKRRDSLDDQMLNDESNSGEEIIALFICGAGATRNEAIALHDAGFSALEEVAYVPIDELQSAMPSNVTRANELRANARRTVLSD